jgi:OFA family oxalate/formate antiporter-like MFS transporter
MKKILVVISSFFIMLCLGSVYAWSLVSTELIFNYGFSSVQSQLVFGLLIAVFPVTMIFAGKYETRIGTRNLAVLSAVFFSAGYLLSGFSNGNFWAILFGVGILTGIGTGLGYLVALTTPVKYFPNKKGLVTGISTAGFGLAAFIFSLITEKLLLDGKRILDIFLIIAIVYGFIILFFSVFLKAPSISSQATPKFSSRFSIDSKFIKLFTGIFLGTFAGLLVIGNLKLIGSEHAIPNHTLVIGVSVFAIANFTGRLAWGNLSDYINANICIVTALTLQAVSVFLIGLLDLNSTNYLLLSAIIGFSFGSNFVLFAKKTTLYYGVDKLGLVYPYVFLGYAIAGIAGPLTGGAIYDIFKNYDYASFLASAISLSGAVIFLKKNMKS